MKVRQLFCFVILLALPARCVFAQPLEVLHCFQPYLGPDGVSPKAGLTQNGHILYGTTEFGGDGAGGSGTIFGMQTNGSGFVLLHKFGGPDGSRPISGLVWAGKMLYGTTSYGGANGYGTIFGLATNGTSFATLHDFAGGSDGKYPSAGLVLSGQNLYGTTGFGGGSDNGTIFKITTDGSGYAVIYRFTPAHSNGNGSNTNADGLYPRGDLVQAWGTLYGTAWGGGVGGGGTIFAVGTNGDAFTVLHSFMSFPDSDALPESGTVLSDGTLYGTTSIGGAHLGGTVFSIAQDGSQYQILHSFDRFHEGGHPSAPVTFSDGRLFGTAYISGTNGSGMVYAIETNGSNFEVLQVFDNLAPSPATNIDGGLPVAGLLIADGTAYGTTTTGGTESFGTLFALKLPVFAVKALPLTIDQDGTVTARFSGRATHAYIVQVSSNLSSVLGWTTVSTNISDSEGFWSFTDTNAQMRHTLRFYRAAVP